MSLPRQTKWLWLCGVLALCSGCLHPGQPVVADRSPVLKAPARPADGVSRYTVRRGDTLYSIAWRFELSYQGLARANGISAPYTIRPGQVLRITAQMPASQRVRSTKRAPSTQAKPAPAATKRPAPGTTKLARWQWPLSGKPGREFGKANSGVDYFLSPGGRARVSAANSGAVVYAGNGIGGYEHLVIVKHTRNLLSAYSFDGEIRVAEQQSVKAGAKLADIKSRGRTQQSLHFELRRDGEPINPRTVMP